MATIWKNMTFFHKYINKNKIKNNENKSIANVTKLTTKL